MTPTPEEIEALRKSSATLAALCDKAARADEMEAKAAILAAERNVMPSFSSTATATEVAALARENKHLGVEVIRLTGELAEARAEVARLCREVDATRVARNAFVRLKLEKDDEIATLRAKNGRQASTIAAMRGAGKVRIENPRVDLHLPEMVTPPLRLEVGRTYVRRDGGLETIQYEDHRKERDFRFVTASSHAYREDGRFCAADGHPADLIAEAPAEEEPPLRPKDLRWLTLEGNVPTAVLDEHFVIQTISGDRLPRLMILVEVDGESCRPVKTSEVDSYVIG